VPADTLAAITLTYLFIQTEVTTVERDVVVRSNGRSAIEL